MQTKDRAYWFDLQQEAEARDEQFWRDYDRFVPPLRPKPCALCQKDTYPMYEDESRCSGCGEGYRR